jgi:probable phosphoglycerate mutase
MQIICVRHGETVENKKGLFQGHMPGELTPLGIDQINKLKQAIQGYPITAIYSSDLKRAKDSATILADALDHKHIQLDSRLREIDWGDLTGKKCDHHDIRDHQDTIESHMDIRERALAFIQEIKDHHKDETVLIVSHGLLIRMLIISLLELPLEALDRFVICNASISTLSFDTEWKLLSFNQR